MSAMAKPEKKESYLSKVFPVGTVKFEGITIVVTPLSIEKLILVAGNFEKLISLKAQGKTDKEIALLAMSDIQEILQHCVDKELKEIPTAMFPMIARVFLRQHLSEEIMGEWLGLFADAAQIFGTGILGAIQARA